MKAWGDLKMNWDVSERDEVKDWPIHGTAFPSRPKITLDLLDSLLSTLPCTHRCIYL